MFISAGKLRGLKRLCDAQGRFKMVAVDQRPPLIKGIGEKRGRPAAYEELADVKALLTRRLLADGSAVLIDPDYGFSTAEPDIRPDRGLLITLEDFRFEETSDGRKTRIMEGWSVDQIKRLGADGVKLLLWYRPDAGADVIRHQQDLVRRVGADCARCDIPLLLELLVYPFAGAANHTTDYIEDRDKRPELVLQSARDFADASFGVDIYKLESPLTAASLPDPEADMAETRVAQVWFDKLGAIIDRPWVMLSAGAGMEEFRRVLGFAYRAGANGYLAGRAIWWKAFGAYPDLAAMDASLAGEARGYMAEINWLTDKLARPWQDAPAIGGRAMLAVAGHDFPARYAGFCR
ncbi:tagatose 1,6-diphosphate aldolase [Phreatobacter stygius]|uniref:Tagatose 1,6-diphosphate aldolase n=1 Tax=Phreatobacter stygius TaxID=1940610 RepID=A0A4D7BHK3_9HYPH|nr:tagatose 1,6-diphosphate aldolase [Phreatobacter stygius]QCI67287.1 tagatose 1,6-diphosphate aldolase [Phreatobacter stygius]